MNCIEKATEARKLAQRRDVEQSMQMRTVNENKEGEEFPEGGSMTETPEEAAKREGRDCIGYGLFCWVIGVICFNGDDFCRLGSIPFFLIGVIVFGGHPRAPRLVKWLGRLSFVAVYGTIAVVVVAVVVSLLFGGLSAMWGGISHIIGK